MSESLKAPFPWFGGKSRVAPVMWERFGDVQNYVEPFFGSGATLLQRAQPFRGVETVNDLDGYICNFWRATTKDPDAVAYWADYPVNELDLHARHDWLVQRKAGFTEELRGNPDFFDAKVAGWWVWGISCWIGSDWCNDQKMRIHRKRPDLGSGKGVTSRQIPCLRHNHGSYGQGIHAISSLRPWFSALQARLRNVRVCCGDWSRICGPTPTWKGGLTAIVLDPPYGKDRDKLYACDSTELIHGVSAWCRENGDNRLLRIALCGYEGYYDLPNWSQYRWKAHGGMGNISNGRGKENATRECIWFSPYCLQGAQKRLFG